MAYSDYKKEFEIFTDVSPRQVGAEIVQDDRPIVICSRKLTQAQKKYTIIELEFLTTIETLKEFRGMLWS